MERIRKSTISNKLMVGLLIKESEKRRMNKKLLAGIVALVVLIGGGTAYFVAIKPHQDAVANLEKVTKPLQVKNVAYSKVISKAKRAVKTKKQPLDAETRTKLQTAIKTSEKELVKIPKTPSATNDIKALTKKLSVNVDYSTSQKTLTTNLAAFQKSVVKAKLVTNPTANYVIGKMKNVATVSGAQAVTESNDPNGNLNKAGGYTAAVYFIDSQVTEAVDGADAIAKGTDGGGSIEVYKTVADANKRQTYLTAFDGSGMLNPGSHVVVGTCIVRTSLNLTASQQTALTKQITDALTQN